MLLPRQFEVTMHPLLKRSFFAVVLATAGIVVASPDAAGQSMGDASVTDASAAACDSGPAVSDASAMDDYPAFVAPPGALPTDKGAAVLDDGSVLPGACMGPDIFAKLGITNPNITFRDYRTITAPYTTEADCEKFDSQGHPAVHNCLCKNCFTVQQQCDALAGCRAIQKCGADSGCMGANGCYFGGACSAVIDGVGTGSVATGLSNALQTCGAAHSCPLK
jgi:hypothetical protein